MSSSIAAITAKHVSLVALKVTLLPKQAGLRLPGHCEYAFGLSPVKRINVPQIILAGQQ
jgi:hypothetical protein